MFKKQGHQDIASRFVRRIALAHRTACSLHNIHQAPLGGEERHHIHRWHIDAFGEATGIGNKCPFAFGKGPHDGVSRSTGHRAVYVKRG